jgi:hypothetical protein
MTDDMIGEIKRLAAAAKHKNDAELERARTARRNRERNEQRRRRRVMIAKMKAQILDLIDLRIAHKFAKAGCLGYKVAFDDDIWDGAFRVRHWEDGSRKKIHRLLRSAFDRLEKAGFHVDWHDNQSYEDSGYGDGGYRIVRKGAPYVTLIFVEDADRRELPKIEDGIIWGGGFAGRKLEDFLKKGKDKS